MTPAAPALLENESDAPTASRQWLDWATLVAVTACVVGAAAAWYLLKELAPLLRPLLLAVFLAYIIVPVRLQLKRHTHDFFSFLVVLIGVLVVMSVGAVLVYSNIVDFNRELPHLIDRGKSITHNVRGYFDERLPSVAQMTAGTTQIEEQVSEWLRDSVGGVANVTVGVILEAIEILFYLIFLLYEAGHFSGRIRSSFPEPRAERILKVAGQINHAMADYLQVKVKASLMLALPCGVLMWLFGVHFAFLWAVLLFFGNFIPYFGSIGVCLLAALYGFLQMDFGWRPVLFAVSLFALRTIATDLLEPAITGKAVNLSPLVILAALSFWSLCWGITGMLLAVPLTVMIKIIFENLTPARPIAGLMTEAS